MHAGRHSFSSAEATSSKPCTNLAVVGYEHRLVSICGRSTCAPSLPRLRSNARVDWNWCISNIHSCYLLGYLLKAHPASQYRPLKDWHSPGHLATAAGPRTRCERMPCFYPVSLSCHDSFFPLIRFVDSHDYFPNQESSASDDHVLHFYALSMRKHSRKLIPGRRYIMQC